MIASVQVFLALPWIFGETLIWGPRSDTAVAHLTRDGVIGLVLGLAGVAVALTPRLAYFALSICGLLVTLQAVAFIIDRANSTAHPVFETIHVLAVLITALVVIIAFPRRTRR
jgi:bacteriorhodopsin